MKLLEWDDLPEKMKNEEVRYYYEILEKKRIHLLFKRIFDNAFTEIVNRTQAIASVDNAMYDMEQKHKVKTLTKPNDDQK